MSRSDVTAARAAAVAAYAAACEALQSAYVELRACDEAAGTRAMSPTGQYPVVHSFIDKGKGLPMWPRHADAGAHWPAEAAVEAAVAARVGVLVDTVLPA